ncbi:beta-lactamase regulating signal transducer with metallopeptidase domain [Silvibacterium bohemicum]|uniref:Beta-lactamase regulating signal transducer with metallopeptidase domain n=1 Tax=Silvibacterium bohemicum TaxID=1577686 RepID=A0A841JLZ2_9BACT|nr:M56 family metallopeptidase [Silvibacterium bohemicum]MBB6142366.1 beta-lactamase regulating signal transducer with metallopeptidase domain [Silvibacterium bohemicum]
MEHATGILSTFSAALAGSLVTAIWEGTVLAASIALCLHLVKGIPAAVRSALWTAVLLFVVLLHFVPFFGIRSAEAQLGAAKTLHVDLRWSMAIVALWAVFSLVRAAQLVHSAIGLHRIAKRAIPVAASPECAVLLRTRLRSARLCVSADVDRPSVIGFFAPRVLIPLALYEKLPASELEQIVMHEMEHLRRGDDWTNLLQKLSVVLFPLNPVLLFVDRRLCAERELACDDRVLHLTRARKAYATCLVNLAEHSMLRRSASLVLGAWERQSELGRRVRRILRGPESVMGRRQMRLVTSALLLGMMTGAFTLAREPQLISFAPRPALPMEASIMPAARYVPASFRTTMPALKMVDTVFHLPAASPDKQPVKPAIAPKPRLRKAVRTIPANRITLADISERRALSSRMPQRAAVLVLTDWTGVPLPPRLGLVVSDDIYSYAAVPTPNGWLIVQL